MYHRSVLNVLILSTLFISGCNGLLNNLDSSNADLLPSPDFIQTKNEIDTIVSQIESKYPIRISYKKSPKWTWGIVGYTKLSVSDYGQLLKYLKIFQEEFNKYPPEFIRKSNLKWVVIVKNLSYLGHHRAAIPDYRREILYYDVAYGGCGTRYLRHVVHHEFYHMIEEEFNGNVFYKDTDWSKLNSKDFKYGKGGWHFIKQLKRNGSNFKKPFHPRPGFVTPYATSGLEEDKAEVYAYLFVEDMSACLNEWISEDEILRNKVSYMKNFLLQYSDEMTSDFWANFCTGECLPQSATGFGSYEIQDFRFSAVLPNDANVSLVAITSDSTGPKKMWKPNGETFDENPFTIDEAPLTIDMPKITVDDKLKLYRFFFCTKTNQLPNLERLGERIYEAQSPYFDSNGRIFDNICIVTCGLDDNKETSQLTIGVPLGEWTVEAAYNPKTKVTSGSGHSIKFGKPGKKKGKLKIEVSHGIADYKKTAEKIVAVDHTGEIHNPVSSQGKYTNDEVRMSLHFSDLRLAQVKEFQFKTCPYTWITFENISLRASQITEVQVKVENN